MLKPILSWWNRLPLRTQGIVLGILPFVVVLASTGFSFWGNRQRQNAELDVMRKFAMVSGLNDLLTSTVNAETGVRGFLLTRRPEFLQPYQNAQALLPRHLATLKRLAQSEPGAKPRIDKLARVVRMSALVKEQLRLLAALSLQKEDVSKGDASKGDGPKALYQLLASSKTTEDALREEVRGMRREESRLLSERLGEIRAVRARDYLAIYAVLGIGIISRLVSMWMFNVGIGQRVQNLCENVRCLGKDQVLPYEPSGKPDALGELEREVAHCHNVTSRSIP